MPELLIGLVGHPSSGKTYAARYIAKRFGYTMVTGSDVIRYYGLSQGVVPSSRDEFDRIGKQMRHQHGNTALADRILSTDSRNLVWDGIRNYYYDTTHFKEAGGFLIGLVCPLPIRHRRYENTPTQGTHLSLSAFYDLERREYDDPDPYGSQVDRVLSCVDAVLFSGCPEIDFRNRIDELVRTRLALHSPDE